VCVAHHTRVCVVILHLLSIDPVGLCGVHALAMKLVRGNACDSFSPIPVSVLVDGVASGGVDFRD
jgi:hypothetical protein